MNLLFAISFVRWGGVNTWMLELAATLQERGHHPTILAPKGHLMLERATHLGLQTCDKPFGPDFWSAPSWILELRRRQIHAVMTNTSKENRTVGAAARCLQLPVVQWVGLARDLKRNTLTTRFERRLIVDRLVAECQSMRDDILHQFPYIPTHKLIFIRPGKPRRTPSRTRAELQAELGLNPNHTNAVICSQHTQGKGHPELLQAIAQLRDQGCLQTQGFHLSIFHTGHETNTLQTLTRSLNLDPIVTFRGFSNRVTDHLHAFDLGLLPSHWEGLANNLREYMMAGLCPVVSNLPGSTEVVHHLRNGLVHRTGDAQDLATQLQTALLKPDLVQQLRQQAHADAETFFGMDQSVSSMETLFRSLQHPSP